MLIAMISVLSLLVAAGVCVGADAFQSLAWLWVLPLSAFGSFLLLIALWVVLLVVMSKCVDIEKEQTHDSAFYRWAVQLTAPAAIKLLGVKVCTEGFDQPIPKGRFLLVCNHLHDIDPAFLLSWFPHSQLAFIAKREVQEMFLVGPILKKMLGQFVNRENDREALKTILKCIQIIKEDKASVSVFPEGWVSLDRKLHPFRPGVFKIAQKAKVPVVVCTLRDTHKVIPALLKLQRPTVHLHLVGVIPAQELEGITAVDVAHRAYTMMAEDLGPELVLQQEIENT